MKELTKNRIRASRTRGESMVVVMVLLLIFFSLGAAVMTAAAANASGSSARIAERQVYYLARSTLDTLDDSLRSGRLGTLLCERAKEQLLTAHRTDDTVTSVAVDEETAPVVLENFAFSTDFDAVPLEIRNAQLSYTGYADTLNTDISNNITEVSVRLQNVQLSFDMVYRAKYTYSMRVIYRYSGWGEAQATGTDWRWNGTWIVQQVG